MVDVFNSETNPETVPSVTDLVGEGKKFKDVDALARGKLEADAFIEKLKSEAAEKDRRLSEAANADAQLAALREEMQVLKEAQARGSQPATPVTKAQDIQAIVEETITRAELKKTETQNVTEANRIITDAFGADKAAEVVVKRAEELGLSLVELRAIAAKSPSAFKRIVVGDAELPGKTQPLNHSTVNPNIVAAAGAVKQGSKEYYQDLLRTSPKKYFDPATQRQILKDMQAGTYIP